jgi:F-type H+-transporting ATPase subunit b
MKFGTTWAARVAVGALVVAAPATAFAAGDGPNVSELISSIVNFAIYVSLLAFFAGPLLKKHLQTRADAFRTQAEDSARRAHAAEEKLAAAKARMETVEREREEMLTQAQAMGEAERDRMVATAREQAAKMREDATLAIAADARQAEEALRARLFEEALDLAERELASSADARRHAAWIDDGIDQYTASGVVLH